jgi:hypothetical protein
MEMPQEDWRRLGDLLEEIASDSNWQVVAREVIPDHVYILAQVWHMLTNRRPATYSGPGWPFSQLRVDNP